MAILLLVQEVLKFISSQTASLKTECITLTLKGRYAYVHTYVVGVLSREQEDEIHRRAQPSSYDVWTIAIAMSTGTKHIIYTCIIIEPTIKFIDAILL